MNNNIRLIFLLVISILFSCTVVRDHPLDEGGSNFIEPHIELDSIASTITPEAVIHYNFGSVTIMGNRVESRFRICISGQSCTKWVKEGTFSFDNLEEGQNSITIETMYDGGILTRQLAYDFYVQTEGYKPFFTRTKERVFTIHADSTLRIAPSITGVPPFVFQWYRYDDTLKGKNSDTLIITAAAIDDAGTYYCTAGNLYGTAISAVYIVNVTTDSLLPGKRVRYNSNGADDGTLPVDETLYQPEDVFIVLGNLGDLTKKGFTFAGWNSSQNGDGTGYPPGTRVIMGTTEITLFAWWTDENTYTLHYDGSGAENGEVPVDNNRYLMYVSATIMGNVGALKKQDSLFVGWVKNREKTGKLYAPGDTLVISTEDIILYVKWEALPRCHVVYSKNGGTGDVPVDTTIYRFGSSAVVAGNDGVIEKADYTFTGWCLSADGQCEKLYGKNDTVTVSDDTVFLYARWTSEPVYSVVYHANSPQERDVPIDANSYPEGARVTVKEKTATLTNDGYTFAGWNRNEDLTGDTCQPQERFTMPSTDVHLYALWTTEETYSVLYNSNGSTGGNAPVDNNNHLNGAVVTVKGSGTLLRRGYSFLAWNTKQNGSGSSYYPDSTLTIEKENIELYPIWKKNRYIISFNSMGGTEYDTVSVEFSDTIIAPADPEKTGYIFNGWFKEVEYLNKWDFSTDSVTSDLELFACWNAVPAYNVFYDGNAEKLTGNPPIDTSSYQSGDSASVLDNTGNLIRGGYIFGWWNTAPDGNGDSYSADNYIVIEDENITLYAHWLEKYTITYHLDGGSNSENNPAFVVTTSNTIPLENPVKEGFGFGGWFSNAEFTGSAITAIPGGTTEDIDLYAQWSQNIIAAIVQISDIDQVYSGTPREVSVTTVPTSLAVTITYDSDTNVPVNSGVYTVFASVSEQGYTGTASATLRVAKATPSIISVPTAAEIVYGQSLTSATLSGGEASVEGVFAFIVPSTTPAVGTDNHSVTFTPVDTANYTSIAAGVASVTVAKAVPVITSAPTAAEIDEGETLAHATLSGGVASVAGSFAFTDPDSIPLAGTTEYQVTFTPTNRTNYTSVQLSVSVTVAEIPTVEVQLSQSKQTIQGFGINATLIPVTSLPWNELFTLEGTDALGLSILRIGMDSNGSLSGVPSGWETARTLGAKIIGTCWSAPGAWKTNSQEIDGGHLISEYYDDWATRIAAFANNYNLYAMSIANEVDFSTACAGTPPCTDHYASMVYTAKEMVEFVKVAGTIFDEQAPDVKMIAPETAEWVHLWSTASATQEANGFYDSSDPLGCGCFSNEGNETGCEQMCLEGDGYNYGHWLAEDTEAWNAFDILGVHQYDSQIAYPWPVDVTGGVRTREVWQTEMSGKMYWPEQGPTATIENGVAVARWIQSALTVGEASAWCYWWYQAYYLNDNEGLAYIKEGGAKAKRYYTYGNYSRYMRPGQTVVNITRTDLLPENVLLTASKDDDGKVVIVAVNETTSAQSVPISIVGGTVPASLKPIVTADGNRNWEEGSAVPVTDGVLTAELDPMSVTTFVSE